MGLFLPGNIVSERIRQGNDELFRQQQADREQSQFDQGLELDREKLDLLRINSENEQRGKDVEFSAQRFKLAAPGAQRTRAARELATALGAGEDFKLAEAVNPLMAEKTVERALKEQEKCAAGLGKEGPAHCIAQLRQVYDALSAELNAIGSGFSGDDAAAETARARILGPAERELLRAGEDPKSLQAGAIAAAQSEARVEEARQKVPIREDQARREAEAEAEVRRETTRQREEEARITTQKRAEANRRTQREALFARNGRRKVEKAIEAARKADDETGSREALESIGIKPAKFEIDDLGRPIDIDAITGDVIDVAGRLDALRLEGIITVQEMRDLIFDFLGLSGLPVTTSEDGIPRTSDPETNATVRNIFSAVTGIQ